MAYFSLAKGLAFVLVTGAFLYFLLARSGETAVLAQEPGERDALGEHLSLLSRHANDIVLLLDEAGCIVRANERAREAYGKRSGAGTPALELRAPSAKAGFPGAYARTLRLGSLIYETTHLHGDGREFPVEISARRIDTPEGKFVQAIIRDLSERRSAEQALAESEARFRAIVEQSISGFYAIQDGRFVYVNPRFASIFGYASPNEVIGRIPDDLIVPRDRALVTANIERRLAGAAKSIAYTFTGLRKDGSELEVGVHGTAATFDGRPAIVGILQDISERARLERERDAQLARMQAQLEAVSAISSSPALLEGSVEDFAGEVTAAAAKATGVERADVWLFNPRETELRCIDLYEATPARHSSGAVLTEAQYKNEFEALKRVRYVDAHDALADPRTAGYVEGYLNALGITSMLDAVVRVGERHIGLLCLEHVGRAHHWERDEISFACQLADQLALAVVQRERQRATEGLQASTGELRKVNRALRTLSAGNETLVRAPDEATLLRDMCSVIVQAGGYRLAAVGYVQPGAGHPIAPQASAGIPWEELRDIPFPRADPGHPLSPRLSAARSGATLLHLHPAKDPGFAPWRDIIVRHGLASAISMPLRAEASAPPFGVLVIAASDPDAFDAEAVRLFEEMANDLAFGIGILRLREEQKASAAVLRKSLEDTILAIAATAEMRDPYTAGHERRVAELAAAIGREMGLAEPLIEGIRFGAMIHDLGKIKIPAEILVKPARLSPIEYELIKQHAQAGYDILKGIDFPWPVAQMVLEHHERLDGSGYPNGQKGEAICQEARILSVADTVEAMSSHRPYRPGLGIDKALAEIERGRGAQYDPAAVDACLRLYREKGYTLPG